MKFAVFIPRDLVIFCLAVAAFHKTVLSGHVYIPRPAMLADVADAEAVKLLL